jgi:hypothetical protein
VRARRREPSATLEIKGVRGGEGETDTSEVTRIKMSQSGFAEEYDQFSYRRSLPQEVTAPSLNLNDPPLYQGLTIRSSNST